MFKLTIKNADASVYWTQKFKTMALLNAWLDEEKTRSYWKQEFTTEILDVTPVPVSPDPAMVLRRQQMLALKARLEDLDAQVDLTAAELKELARKLFKLLKLKGITEL